MKSMFEQVLNMTEKAIQKATPVIQQSIHNVSNLASCYIETAKKNRDAMIDDSQFESVLDIEVDSYSKELLFPIIGDRELAYYITCQKRLFKTTFHLYTKDDFELAHLEKKTNAKRQVSPEFNPIDFLIYMGNDAIEPMRTYNRESFMRSYLFGDWLIERQVMASDFFIYDGDKIIAQFIYAGKRGSYHVQIKEKKYEVMVLLVLMAIEAEYTN